MNPLFLNQLSEFVLLHVLAYAEGLLVLRYNWKVNYTRKINHFFVFFSPYLLKLIFPYEENFRSQLLIALVGMSTLFIYVRPIRTRVRIVATMFAAFDRPEDRPHTLKWLFTQYFATYAVAVPLWLCFDRLGHQEAVPIIILINAIGDGLAEPVGVRWGKHRYAVSALFTKRIYQRSWEGSACVFITAVIALLVYGSHFSGGQLALALLTIPVTATMAEALSPHTWDSPFIFLFTGLGLLLVYAM